MYFSTGEKSREGNGSAEQPQRGALTPGGGQCRLQLTRRGGRARLRAEGKLKAEIPVRSCTVFLAGVTLTTASEEKVKRYAVREDSGWELRDGLFGRRP
jgi:hypothetical protein